MLDRKKVQIVLCYHIYHCLPILFKIAAHYISKQFNTQQITDAYVCEVFIC